MKITLRNGFTEEDLVEKVEKLFEKNKHRKELKSCSEICDEHDTMGCHHCAISFPNSGWGASDILANRFILLERKLKLKKLLEQ